jgi:hypothetical protein
MKILFSLFLCAVVSPSFATLSPSLAAGKVKLSSKLLSKAKGIRTLFVTVYDSHSQMPMPYGALRVALEKDADGEFYTFDLEPSKLMLMGPSNAAVPSSLNIKAKLDKDGAAGPDSSGDLVGWVKNIKTGSRGLQVTIDKAVP